ncbi:unnamed protein product [Rhizophagus irregularis]|nr:unnamed protein product [Rhizophagus irregularis]
MPPKRKAVQLTLIERSEPVPRSKGRRPQDTLNITDFWDNEHNKALSKPRQDSIDQSSIKIFVCYLAAKLKTKSIL